MTEPPPQFEPLTPVEAERQIRWVQNHLTRAQADLRDARDEEVAAKHIYERAYRKVILSGDCPRVTRDGYTAAERDAWVADRCAEEHEAYELAEVKRSRIQPMSAKQRAARAAEGDAYPSTTFRRQPTMRTTTRPGTTGPDQATVDAALQRDQFSCVVCGGALHGDRGTDWSIHHRLRRSQGGDNRLSNLVSVCGHGTAGDHGAIHAAPEVARRAGWMLRRGDDPTLMVMAHAAHGHVYLTNDGGWQTRRPSQGNSNESEG